MLTLGYDELPHTGDGPEDSEHNVHRMTLAQVRTPPTPMAPGRGAGADTALRDARELWDRLVRVRDGEPGLVEAVGEYEQSIRTFSALAVRNRCNS